MTQLSQKQQNEIFSQIYQIPGNNRCADCQALQPGWASITFGILICYNCSGCHRGMGYQISRVRSVTLDSWTDEQVQIILNIGNRKSNNYYELYNKLAHLASDDSSKERSEYIINKYIKRQFAQFKNEDTPEKNYHDKLTQGDFTIMRAAGLTFKIANEPKSPKNVFLDKFLKKSLEINKTENLIDFTDNNDSNSESKQDTDCQSNQWSDNNLVNIDFSSNPKKVIDKPVVPQSSQQQNNNPQVNPPQPFVQTQTLMKPNSQIEKSPINGSSIMSLYEKQEKSQTINKFDKYNCFNEFEQQQKLQYAHYNSFQQQQQQQQQCPVVSNYPIIYNNYNQQNLYSQFQYKPYQQN